MTVVIDVGCARYGGDFSIERLIEEFQPDFLYGFDPNWDVTMFTPWDGLRCMVDITTAAAWTYDGEIGFIPNGLGSSLSYEAGRKAPCVDLARWMWEDMPAVRLTDGHRHKVVLKVDAEGSEYELLEHLIEQGADELLSLAWIEWHPFGAKNPAMRRKWIEDHMRCEVVEWRW